MVERGVSEDLCNAVDEDYNERCYYLEVFSGFLTAILESEVLSLPQLC